MVRQPEEIHPHRSSLAVTPNIPQQQDCNGDNPTTLMGGSEIEDVAMVDCDTAGPHMIAGNTSGSRDHSVVVSLPAQLDLDTSLSTNFGPSVSASLRNVSFTDTFSQEVIFIFHWFL
jgi:hypothetical protein